MTADARALIEELIVLMAAARMPAMTSPAIPAGSDCTMNREKIWSPGRSVGSKPDRPDRDADEQEQRELKHHDEPGTDQRHLRVPQGPGGKEALHDQLVRAVRCGGEERATDDPAKQRIGIVSEIAGLMITSLPASAARASTGATRRPADGHTKRGEPPAM